MSLASLFNWSVSVSSEELPNIFPFSVKEGDFVTTDVINIFSRILTDVLERTQGIPDKEQNLLWDNCVASESPDGLVTMLAKAMVQRKELYLVYNKALKLIREATQAEATEIRADYKARGESKVGVYITFKNYGRTDMIKLYSALEYCTVAALHKNLNLAKAIMIKISDLRASVGLSDRAEAVAQMKDIAEGLADGRDIGMDAKDAVEMLKPDLTPTEAAMQFINEKRSFYLGLPASYITGVAPKGLGDSGVGDAKAIERGLKNYYFSVVKPVIEKIFGINTTFKSEDFQQLDSALEAMKTFELTSDELVSQDNKRILMNKLLGLPEDTQGDAPKKIEAPTTAPAVPFNGKAAAV